MKAEDRKAAIAAYKKRGAAAGIFAVRCRGSDRSGSAKPSISTPCRTESGSRCASAAIPTPICSAHGRRTAKQLALNGWSSSRTKSWPMSGQAPEGARDPLARDAQRDELLISIASHSLPPHQGASRHAMRLDGTAGPSWFSEHATGRANARPMTAPMSETARTACVCRDHLPDQPASGRGCRRRGRPFAEANHDHVLRRQDDDALAEIA